MSADRTGNHAPILPAPCSPEMGWCNKAVPRSCERSNGTMVPKAKVIDADRRLTEEPTA